ncbi:nectin-4-like isoform X1, partial [Scomber scombrus]
QATFLCIPEGLTSVWNIFMACFRTYVTLLLLLFIPVSASKDPEKKTVKPGHNVTLQCHGPKNAKIIILEWSRPDQEDRFVFSCRDGHFRDEDQHPSFRGRVQLQDPQMKDGNVSLILKNVNINDTGTYTCRVSVSNTVPELINTINLTVTGSGQNNQTEERKDGGDEDGGDR